MHSFTPRYRRVVQCVVIGLVLAALQLLTGCRLVRHVAASAAGLPPVDSLVIDLDPVDLPANADHHESPQPPAALVALPTRGLLQGFSLEVLGARGGRPGRGVVHHVQLLLPGQRELFMPLAMRLIGAGPETPDTMLPRTLGLPLEPGDSLLLTAMLHNPTGAELSGVRVRMTVYYTPLEGVRLFTPVYPLHMNIAGPGEPADFDLAPGRSERSWQASPAVDGYVLGFDGHLHRYGVELRFEDVTADRVLWRARPRSDADGDILSIPRRTHFWTRGVRLHAGRTYRLTAVYENPTGRVIPGGGMGTVVGIMTPIGTWPAVDRADPLYARDLAAKLTQHDRVDVEHVH